MLSSLAIYTKRLMPWKYANDGNLLNLNYLMECIREIISLDQLILISRNTKEENLNIFKCKNVEQVFFVQNDCDR